MRLRHLRRRDELQRLRDDGELRLVPRQQGAFQSLDLTVTKQKYALQDLILTDAMGSVTEMHFTLVRIDTDVPDAEFEFVPPPGVQVIKAG
ncbi:MAG TPA: hypothetical protein PLA94_02550 [Myxococcota bacterium]|nr:hypothetical protein [Myxococcota bacterium]